MVVKYFKNSHTFTQRALLSIIGMSEEHEYQQLVTYKVRWLSLNDCIQRFTDLLPGTVCYLEQEAHNTANWPSECAKLQGIYVDPEFQLYLYFFQGHLAILGSINTQLQYLFIAKCFKNEPILKWVDDGMQDSNICTDVDNRRYYKCNQFQQ